jgi:glycosyltransferase involved in cell wall biosynthesis
MVDISVIIPTLNRKEYLSKSIASCFRGNESVHVEVIVVDNGSTDGTQDWLRTLDNERIRIFREETAGAPAARNRGLEAARGTFVRFLDDDDWLASGALANAVRFLQEEDVDVCYGPIHTETESGVELDPLSDYAAPNSDLLVALLKEQIAYQTPRFTYRHALAASEKWDPELPVRQDYDFALTVALNDPSHGYCEGAGYHIRHHDGDRISNSYSKQEHFESQLHSARKIRDRLEPPVADQRRDALANRSWQLAHIAGSYDLEYVDAFLSLLRDIDPSFTPRRRFRMVRLLDRWIGPHRVEHVLFPFRRAKQQVQQIWHP